MHVGIIGVGLMGHGIALNILKAGFSLILLDHPGNQPDSMLTGMGAVATPVEVSELATALATGLVVGQENPLPNIFNLKLSTSPSWTSRN